jgi:hypothetical protein
VPTIVGMALRMRKYPASFDAPRVLDEAVFDAEVDKLAATIVSMCEKF